MHLMRFTFMDGVTSQSVMSVDGEEIPEKALEKMMLQSFPESRESRNGGKMTWYLFQMSEATD